MNNKILAVFDLDGTLTSNGSLEKSFARFAYQEGMLAFSSMLLHAAYFISIAPFDTTSAVKRNKLYLRGITAQNLDNSSQKFISLYGHKLLASHALPLLESHRQMGHMNILITGSLNVLVSQLVSHLKLPFDLVFSTRLEQQDGIITGKIDGPHYYGDSKAGLIKELSIKEGADLSRSFCYADSFSDMPMMQLFGNPVAVCPDKKLAAIANQHKWQIIHN